MQEKGTAGKAKCCGALLAHMPRMDRKKSEKDIEKEGETNREKV